MSWREGYPQGEDFESAGCKNFDQRILAIKGKTRSGFLGGYDARVTSTHNLAYFGGEK